MRIADKGGRVNSPDPLDAQIEGETAEMQKSAPNPKPPMSPARVGGMVATVALLIMFALVAVVIWVAA